MKILIVCCDAQIAELTAKILERKGYEAICCSDANNIQGLILREGVRLVIADLEADETERIEFCKSVRSMGKLPKLLVIGRSGEEESRILNAGADDWIKKPYQSAVFLARISALLRQSEYTGAEEGFSK